MNAISVRRRALVAAGLVCGTLTVACEDKRVKALDTGITRDSAVTIISKDAKGATPDSFPNVYTRERFLIGGKNYEVLYFTPNNDKIQMPHNGGSVSPDSIPYNKLTPIVFVENKLAGRGWKFWDSVSTANKIPLKKH